jgi:hypothetical protein
MRRIVWLFVVVLLVFSGACYHATIETAAKPSSTIIENKWASCWIFGLVAPKTVATAEKCPSGVAKVETRHSFLNGLVGGLTFGIYTPIHIKVTCAEGGSARAAGDAQEIVIGQGATDEQVIEAFGQAADLAVSSGQPVFVRF